MNYESTHPDTARKYLIHYLEVLKNYNDLLEGSPVTELNDLEYVYDLVLNDIMQLQSVITDEIKAEISTELIEISELLEVIRNKLSVMKRSL